MGVQGKPIYKLRTVARRFEHRLKPGPEIRVAQPSEYRSTLPIFGPVQVLGEQQMLKSNIRKPLVAFVKFLSEPVYGGCLLPCRGKPGRQAIRSRTLDKFTVWPPFATQLADFS